MNPITNVVAYPHPLRAQFRGKNVTILCRGDREGSSTVLQAIDDTNGQLLEWESASQFSQITYGTMQTTGSGQNTQQSDSGVSRR